MGRLVHRRRHGGRRELLRRPRPARPRSQGDRPDPRARDPAGLARGLDLPLLAGHLGHRDRRRRPKQYLYHPAWHEEQGREEVRADPALRGSAGAAPRRRHLRRRRLDREVARPRPCSSSTAPHPRGRRGVRGRDGTFGLATFRSGTSASRMTIVLDFEGKGGADQHAELESARLARVLQEMDDLPGYEVLKYVDEDGDVVDVRSRTSTPTSRSTRARSSRPRTSHLGRDRGRGRGARRGGAHRGRAQAPARRGGGVPAGRGAARQHPAVCRANYIDPRVIDHFLDGRTISSLREQVERRLDALRAPMSSRCWPSCAAASRSARPRDLGVGPAFGGRDRARTLHPERRRSGTSESERSFSSSSS